MSKTDYLKQIRQLVELQKVDDQIFDARQELENAPLDVQELRNRFENIEKRRNHIVDKLSHLEDQRKRLTNEIDEETAKLKKSKNKMMLVGNEREHQAIVREMDTLERSSRAREDDRLALLDELQATNESLQEIDGEYNAVKEELEKKSTALEETLAYTNDQLAVLGKKREQTSTDISKPIFMRYEFIRKRLEHPVIVPVDEGICSGCNIAIPPQTYVELQQGQQILSCPNCQRLIFWSQHFEPDEPVITGNKVEKAEEASDQAGEAE